MSKDSRPPQLPEKTKEAILQYATMTHQELDRMLIDAFLEAWGKYEEGQK